MPFLCVEAPLQYDLDYILSLKSQKLQWLKAFYSHNQRQWLTKVISTWVQGDVQGMYSSKNWGNLNVQQSMLRVSLRKKCPYWDLFWFAFSRIWTEYGEIFRISPYSVRMRDSADQNMDSFHTVYATKLVLTIVRNRASTCFGEQLLFGGVRVFFAKDFH